MCLKLAFLLLLIAIDIKQTSLMWAINGNNGNYEPATKRNPIALYEGNPLCLNYVHWRQSHGHRNNVVRYLVEYRLLWFGILSALDRPYYKECSILITLIIIVNNYIMLNAHYVKNYIKT